LDRSIQVRPFEPRYLDRVVAIERSSFGDDAWDQKLLCDYAQAAPDTFLVARRGRRLAGYLITVVSDNSRAAELVSIAVDPRERRYGVGTVLMDASRAQLQLRKVKTWWLMVATENAAAMRFYQRYGFRRTGKVKRYYGAGRDAYRMRMGV